MRARHSIFFETPLSDLLAENEHLANAAFEMMELNMGAEIVDAEDVKLS